MKWLIAFLNHHGLAAFGWYRLALCAVVAVLVWRGYVIVSPPPPHHAPAGQSAPSAGAVGKLLGHEVAVTHADGFPKDGSEELAQVLDCLVACRRIVVR